MRTYAEAFDAMATARSQITGKPLGHKATHLVWCAFDGMVCLGVKYYNTIIVAYLPNGQYVINSGGWRTMSTASYIREFTPIPLHLEGANRGPVMLPTGHVVLRPVSQPPVDYESCDSSDHENGNWRSYEGTYTRRPVQPWVIGPVLDHTEAKVQKCRTCHGVGQVKHTRSTEYVSCKDRDNCTKGYINEIRERVFRATGLPAPYAEGDFELIEYRVVGCELRRCWGHHVPLAVPVVTHTKCHRCAGVGRTDYGSAGVKRLFMDNIVVDAEGNFVRYGYKPPAAIGRLPKGLEKATALNTEKETA